MIFESNINKVLLEAKPEDPQEIPRDTLDPAVFQTFDNGQDPRLHAGIRAQIIVDVNTLESIVPVVAFYIIGDILTPHYSPQTEISIYVEVDPEQLDNISVAEVLYQLRRMNGRLAPNTTHPLVYYIIPNEIDNNELENKYNIASERWEKKPELISSDLNYFLTKFTETIDSIDIISGDLKRHTFNFEEVKNMPHADRSKLRYEIQKLYNALQKQLNDLAEIYSEDKLENLAADDSLDKDLINFVRVKYKLPENFTYKLYKKYYFQKFMRKLDDLLTYDGDFSISQLMNSRNGKYFGKA